MSHSKISAVVRHNFDAQCAHCVRQPNSNAVFVLHGSIDERVAVFFGNRLTLRIVLFMNPAKTKDRACRIAPRRRATDRVEHLEYVWLFEVPGGSDMRIDLCKGLVAIVTSALFVGGCGGEPAEEAKTDELANSKAVCAYDPFDATVKAGPSAGLVAKGALTLIEEMDGSLRGKLESKDANGQKTSVPVTGMVTATSIDLTFTLPDGGVIHGTGTLDKPFETCPEPMNGTLIGPQVGDTGDWGGYGSRCFNDCRAIGGTFSECLIGCALFY